MAPAPSPFHQFSAGIGWSAWYITLSAVVWERDRCENRLPVTAQSHAAGPGHCSPSLGIKGILLTCTSPWAQVHFISGTVVGGGAEIAARLADLISTNCPAAQPSAREQGKGKHSTAHRAPLPAPGLTVSVENIPQGSCKRMTHLRRYF